MIWLYSYYKNHDNHILYFKYFVQKNREISTFNKIELIIDKNNFRQGKIKQFNIYLWKY